ncbi:hypothetical protein [Bradyrhizobium sp. STM 3557]|uniref:hypothetical protein n=1 Tax=Bradyrhizobium sp. STM 3557 TaxID=578920 RepID=UPI00388FE535
MRVVRAILAIAIALSLAMLPVGASAAGVAVSTDGMQMHMAGDQMHHHQMQHHQMHMGGQAEMSMDDCCPDDMKGTASQTSADKCGMGFCCIGGALALGDVRPVAFAFIAVAASKIAIPADQVASFQSGSPPFRPPRI